MHFAVLADIHGNLVALEAVVQDARQYGVDGFWILGDSVVGPAQNAVLHLLRALPGCIIRGNSEDYLLDYDIGCEDGRCQRKQWSPVSWAYHNLDPDLFAFIATLPEQRVVAPDGADPVRLVHGSPRHIREPLFPNHNLERMQRFKEGGFLIDGRQPVVLEDVLAGIDETVLACGHTHIPWVQQQDGYLAFSAGSVGSPIDGDTRAQYALLTWDDQQWQVELKAVPYDLERVRDSFEANGFMEATGALGRAIWLSVKTGQNVIYYLVVHARRLAVQAGLGDCAVVPDEIWDRAVETLDWELAASGNPLF
ncbi:MAG: metallophosphoesterase family protein [Anaerolineae bacterium]|nr:metallophosphoesterase family protein [Anaerolineae bacterium]